MGLKYQIETSELAQEAIQRTLIKTDETSLIIYNIYRNEEDGDIVFERLSKCSGTDRLWPGQAWHGLAPGHRQAMALPRPWP